MAFNWDGFTPALTAPQQAAMAYFESLGRAAANGGNGLGGGSPSYTMSQAKAARAVIMDVAQKAEAAMRGVRGVMEHHRAATAKAYEDANP